MDAARMEGTLWNVVYYLVGAVSRFLSPEPSNVNNDPVQESKSDNQNDSGGVREDQSDMGACQLNKSLPPRTGTEDQLKIEPQPEGYEKTEDNLPETGINSTDINKEDIQIHTSEMNTVDLKHTSNGESDAMTAEVEVDNNCMAEVEVKVSQEIGKAFKNPPLSVCEPACEEQPPEHNNEASPDGNKTQGFLEAEEMQTHRQLQEEAENLGNTTLPEQKSNALKDDMEDLQEEIDLERTLRLCDASGGDNETRKETAGFPHEKLHTDQVILDTTSSDESFDPEQDELANESMDRRNDTESFSVISSPELDYSFGESASTWEAAKALERADDGDVLKSNVLETRKMDSEEELLTKILQSSDKVEKPKNEAEVGSFALNFAPQRSRIAAKNPRVRPPKDRRSLLLRPSVDPETAPPEIPKSKIPAGVHVLGGLGFGLKLPGFGSGLPVVKKVPKMEVELKPVPETDATKRAEVPHKPKWMPPKQAGFGNPFISELKTKLKKATKN